MDRTQALKATRNGAIVACISGVLTLGVALLAMQSGDHEALQLWGDPAILVDVIIIFACAYGISRQSRVAAVLILLYFVLSKIMITIELGRFPSIGMSLVFLYFYAKAIQGAFTFHRLEKAENPNYRAAPRCAVWVFAPVALVIAGFMGLGVLSEIGVTPSYLVQPGHEVDSKFRAELAREEIIETGELIEHFYSFGLTSVLEGGVVLTNERVLIYYPEYGEITTYDLYFDEIANIELVEPGNFMNDAVYRVSGHDPGSWLQIPLATDNRGDVEFIEALRANVAVGLASR